ncbi:hypothetical protein [Streptomyces sp. NBC_01803]|uniref:hypothetical protein n=1 Tax=Streptomyces sp. NBC_01803 TaxID=2975946 RepID=UPI002DDB362D|nr:hypothetical protein [Streptomyces sp. NBC_01803]WSA43668.1 hypothetical protein OIE51_05280 [Streptomyces sp. NBC_01803]
MNRRPSRGVLRHLTLVPVLAGVAWHVWRGSSAGLVLAAAALAAHGAAAALGYWWLRHRPS